MSYFAFHRSPTGRTATASWSCSARRASPAAPFFTAASGYPSYFGPQAADYAAHAERNQYYADLAASIQAVTEEIVLRMARHAHRRTGLPRLCMAGGVALNSVANGRSSGRRRSRSCTSSRRRATRAGRWARRSGPITRSSAGRARFVMEHACVGPGVRAARRSGVPRGQRGRPTRRSTTRTPARPRRGPARAGPASSDGSRAASSGGRGRSASGASSRTRAAPR